MNTLDEILKKFRHDLADRQVTFFLVYTVKNVITDKLDTHIASNSGKQGIRAILSYIMRPTQAALDLIARALQDMAAATVGQSQEAVDATVEDGGFRRAAVILFDRLRPLLTVHGWQDDEEPPT